MNEISDGKNTNEISDKNAWIYLFLLWFFGLLGIHKFYVNKTGLGILYLFTGGLFTIGVFVDYISIFFFKVKDKNGSILEGSTSLRVIALIILALQILAIIFIALFMNY